MGIYDRDYYRQERPLFSVGSPRTAVGVLIVINVALWILDFFTPVTHVTPAGEARWLSDHLAVSGATLGQPWMWWRFLTYGFAHSPLNFGHILWNMFGLFIFGRDLEGHYGRKEFTRLYLAMVVLGGLAWAVIAQLKGADPDRIMYGASGAVTGVVLLFALNFPHRTILLFFVLPVPSDNQGAATVQLPIPDDSGLVGVRLYSQALAPQGAGWQASTAVETGFAPK